MPHHSDELVALAFCIVELKHTWSCNLSKQSINQWPSQHAYTFSTCTYVSEMWLWVSYILRVARLVVQDGSALENGYRSLGQYTSSSTLLMMVWFQWLMEGFDNSPTKPRPTRSIFLRVVLLSLEVVHSLNLWGDHPIWSNHQQGNRLTQRPWNGRQVDLTSCRAACAIFFVLWESIYGQWSLCFVEMAVSP